MATIDPHLAPGALRQVQDFVNSIDLQTGEDRLGHASHLRSWLLQWRLLAADTTIGEDGLARALALREALRALMWANNGMELPRPEADRLNRIASETRLTVRFHADGRAFLTSAAEGASGAIGKLYAIAVNAMAEGTWPRLKACLNETCRWAFFDTSRNSSGTWCSMALCGNRNKAHRYRRRHGPAHER